MYPVEFAAGESVLQQAALPKPDDCLYYLDEGEVDIIISGGADNVSSEERNVEGNKVCLRHFAFHFRLYCFHDDVDVFFLFLEFLPPILPPAILIFYEVHA